MPAKINTAAIAAARARLEAAPRAVLSAVAADLVQNTPVDVGWLRASWDVSVGGTSGGSKPNAPDPSGAETTTRLQAVIAMLPLGETVSFVNSATYAGLVEFGTVKMAPRAFVRGTVARVPAITAEVMARWPAGT